MDKDLIIGYAANYDWDTLKYWVNSIKRSGFTGDIMIVGTNLSEETCQRLVEQDVHLALHPQNKGMAPHVERFFWIHAVLNQLRKQITYRAVIMTDTRDVVFQIDPTKWIDDSFYEMPTKELFVSSEGMLYRDEPWGNQNINQTFGPYIADMLSDKMIYNVGVILGTHEVVESLMLMIFQMSLNRPIPVVDQAVFNFLIHSVPWSDTTTFTCNSDGWAIQLGTTEEAVKAGKGDLGAHGFEAYANKYDDWQPHLQDGYVYVHEREEPDGDMVPFCIVHQWDRIPALAEKIKEIYG